MIGSIQKVESENCAESYSQAVEGILRRLRRGCGEGRKILLMLSGGEAMSAAVLALSQLTGEELSGIRVGQMNEIFSSEDDPKSNWMQFKHTFGSIESLAGVLPIMQYGSSFSEIVNNYDLELTAAVKDSDYVLGVMGIESDGTIAGMRPQDSTKFQLFFNDDLIAGQEYGSDQMVTITDYGMKVMSDVIVLACGSDKSKTVGEIGELIPVHKHPAQLLKIYDRVTLYTNKA